MTGRGLAKPGLAGGGPIIGTNERDLLVLYVIVADGAELARDGFIGLRGEEISLDRLRKGEFVHRSGVVNGGPFGRAGKLLWVIEGVAPLGAQVHSRRAGSMNF